jgi:predicted  nucleic acid-binding Zn-ribbon protein
MENLQINVYAFLGVLEFSLLLLIVTLFFIVRSKNLAGQLRVVQGKLKKAEQLPETVTFDQYLRDEVIHNQHLIERAAASQEDAEKKIAEVLNVRKQFLELEVEVRAFEDNPITFQDKLADGLSELIERLRPEVNMVMESAVKAVETIPQAEEATAAEQCKLLDTHDAEFDRLKKVINNQQDALQALRSELQARDNKVDGLDAGMQKLDEFERQSTELQQRLDVLEKEPGYNTQDQQEKTAPSGSHSSNP